MLRWSAVVLAVACAATAQAQTSDITIELKNGTQAESAARDQLRRLLKTYDLTPWLYTRSVMIDERSAPHSHPVLTVHTAYPDRDDALLATFLHEQMHWRVDERNDEKAKSAMAEFLQLFPEAPGRTGGGARDQASTLLHLIVCDLELSVMTRLVGETRARAVLRSYTHYPWVYERVLSDPRIRAVNTKWGWVISEPPSRSR
jgi:hypothetical protein